MVLSVPVGVLANERDGVVLTLGGHCVVGRASRCDIVIEDPQISTEHASISWTVHGWEIRDLGSTNGTTVNETRLEPSERRLLARGDRAVFGPGSSAWVFLDDAPPVALAVEVDSKVRREGSAQMLLLPNLRTPSACVICDDQGWWCEQTSGREPVEDGEIIVVGEQRWRLFLPSNQDALPTTEVGVPLRALKQAHMRFAVSLDEEDVTIGLDFGTKATEIRHRAFSFLLLTLARARRRDAKDPQLPPAECGWVYVDDLCDELRVSPERLNVHIHRARRHFERLDVVDATRIVERRPGTGAVRIGVASLEFRRADGSVLVVE